MYGLAVVGARGFLGSAITQAATREGVPTLRCGRDDPAVVDGRLADGIADARAVVWCASRVNPRLAAEHPELVERDLADFHEFLTLLSALPEAPRVILLSSGGTVYGPPASPPFSESDAPAPVNAYGASKLALERALADSGLDGVALRVANAYGPGQRPAPGQGVLAHWMTAVSQGRPVGVYGDPDATRDYVFVNDVADAVLAAASAATVPPVLNIGSGEATTLEHLLDALREAVAPAEVEVERGPARATDTTHSTLNVALARESLGWSARTSLHDGVAAMWEWMRS